MAGGVAEIADLAAFVESERLRFGVPGLAVTLVVDGEVVLCEGFGHRDVEVRSDVTPDTHFPLASDTKAFTSAGLCLLADEGHLDLDAPVRDVLPWFAFADDHATALVTPRDLLSHRTGLPRHDYVWIGDNEASIEELVRGIRHLALSNAPRAAWDYNNLAYITAGYLHEVIRQKPWREAIERDLLAPLGMSSTVFSIQDPSIGQLALPYKKVQDGYQLQYFPAPARAIKAGPAGGIVSTARDLGAWLLARLGQAPETLPASALDQLHKPAMLGGIAVELFPEVQSLGYALGCQVESYRGRRIVHHGGNITGYSSDVCVVPGSGVGLAVLTNLDGSYVRLAVMYGLLDRLFDYERTPWGARVLDLMTATLGGRQQALEHHRATRLEAPPSRPLGEFCGRYEHPAYGLLEVLLEGEALVPEFHDLRGRVALMHRGYDAWDLYFADDEVACPLVFIQGSDGTIASLSVRLEDAVLPIVFTRKAAPPAAELVAALIGTYLMGPHELVLRMRANDLLVEGTALGSVVLVAAGESSFTAPSRPGLAVSAQRTPEGGVARLVVEGVGVFERQP